MKVYCLKGLKGFLENQESMDILSKTSAQSAISMFDSMSKTSIFIEQDGKFTSASGHNITISNTEGFMNSIELLEKGIVLTVVYSSRDVRCWFPKGKISEIITEQSKEDGLFKSYVDIEKPVVKETVKEDVKTNSTSNDNVKKLLELYKEFESLEKEYKTISEKENSLVKTLELISIKSKINKLNEKLINLSSSSFGNIDVSSIQELVNKILNK